jgi:hypothetical protein
LVAGGTYLGGSFGPNGTLETWTWLLGTHVEGFYNLLVSAPARQMKIINLPYTLGTGRLVEDLDATPEMVVPPEVAALLLELPRAAVLDHVGSQHYTPHQFAEECRQHGPSRRVNPDIAAQIAPFLPLPIIFTHSDMPIIENYPGLDDVLEWQGYPAGTYQCEPTFFDPAWGLRVKRDSGTKTQPYNGEKHWAVGTLKALHQCYSGKKLNKGLIPEAPRSAIGLHEATFGVSWLTRATYVVRGDESVEQLDEYRNRGIEPMIPEDIG